ncbi:hypothetical protein [Ereboglobus luteus]|uniref:Uncharacterized protein n=1 Tax=Ereboglobus luteus TaxID=1796921 RepID=A0A2U8E5L5_9BACT|nr:hypothetical protein [Ereboglobus luteus]AWI10153.1 hypothetical protein CKA38_13595 [Ereboglobus luteus]
MIRNIIVFCILCLACQATEPKPLLVVATYYAWGGDTPDGGSPSFVLYDDGTIICYHKPAYGEWPQIEKLYTTRKVVDAKKKSEELLSFDLSAAKSDYALTAATCQNETIIWTPAKKIKIYGEWKEPRRFDPSMKNNPKFAGLIKRENELWKTLPDGIRQTLLNIEKEILIAGTPWLPEKIEIILSSYEHSPAKSVNWPKDWPSLNDKSTIKHSDSNYRILFPTKRLAELETFLASREINGPVLIDGRKMSALYRFPLPLDALWTPEPLESFQE